MKKTNPRTGLPYDECATGNRVWKRSAKEIENYELHGKYKVKKAKPFYKFTLQFPWRDKDSGERGFEIIPTK